MHKYTANSPDDLDISHKKDNGCYVKTTTGFILVFLALVVALGVGLIVHFVEKDNLQTNPSGEQSVTSSASSTEKLAQQCTDLAKGTDENSKHVCKLQFSCQQII